MEKMYKYWFFMIKSKYAKNIPILGLPKNTTQLFGYTDKKELAQLFLKLHKKDAFIIKKEMISRDAVNALARSYQNKIIRKVSMCTKNHHNQIIEISIAITENEAMISENRCYAMIDYIYKYTWDSNKHLLQEYKQSLDLFGYSKLHSSLTNGTSALLPKNIQEDLFGALISIYGSIMEVNV